MNLILSVILASVILSNSAPTQFSSCSLCRTIITDLIAGIGSVVTEEQISAYLKLGCIAFGIDDYCAKNLYPNIHQIFLALRSNKTDDIICERIRLCHFKVISMTGDILFAEVENLYTIRELNDGQVQHTLFGVVQHPALPSGKIVGLSCSVDYCAVLLSVHNPTTGVTTYGTTALSQSKQISHVLPDGKWFGPWYDIITQEFWMATTGSNPREYSFGTFDPQFGEYEPKISVRYRVAEKTPILSGQILDRILYFTFINDPHVFKLDLTLHLPRGNISTFANTMLVGNPVTNELYGYAPGPTGVWKFTTLNGVITSNRTTVGSINLSGAIPVASSTINPIENTMWISLWGTDRDAWLRVDLKKTTNNVGWAPAGNLDGLFDFNPYTIKSQEV